jgi:hypothetical protein
MQQEAKRSHHAGVTKVRNAPKCPTSCDARMNADWIAAVSVLRCGWVWVGGCLECSTTARSADIRSR